MNAVEAFCRSVNGDRQGIGSWRADRSEAVARRREFVVLATSFRLLRSAWEVFRLAAASRLFLCCLALPLQLPFDCLSVFLCIPCSCLSAVSLLPCTSFAAAFRRSLGFLVHPLQLPFGFRGFLEVLRAFLGFASGCRGFFAVSLRLFEAFVRRSGPPPSYRPNKEFAAGLIPECRSRPPSIG